MHGFLPSWLYDILYRLRKHWGFARPSEALNPSLPPGIWRSYTCVYRPPPDTHWQHFLAFLGRTPWLSPYHRFDPYEDKECLDA